MATKASSSAVQVGYIPEVTWGVVPSAAVQYFRATSATIKPVINTVTSDELRADGQVTDSVKVGESGTANYGFELSYGNIDAFLAAAFRSVWASDTGFAGAEVGTDLLENGTTLGSFVLENYFSNISKYATLVGARVNQLSLTIQNETKATGSVDFIGKVAAVGTSTLGTGSAVAAPTNSVLSSVNITSFQENSSEIEFMQLDLSINNNARLQSIAGPSSVSGIGYGRFVVTGTLKVFFEDVTLINKVINHTASSLQFALADAAGNGFALQFPRIFYTDADFAATGNDQDIPITVPFQAVLDPTTGKTLRSTRTPA